MTTWLYQMSHTHWGARVNPVTSYRNEVAGGSVVRFGRFLKSRVKKTDPPLPLVKRGDRLVLVFVPRTRLPNGKRIAEPGLYGLGVVTKSEDNDDRLIPPPQIEIRWRPLPETKTLARHPVPWRAFEDVLPKIRGTYGQATMFRIPEDLWKSVERKIKALAAVKWPAEAAKKAKTKTGAPPKESALHKRLKMHVLWHAATLFGPGWSPYALEYTFPETGDRIDVVLSRGQQFLAVEVKTAARDLSGVLQALKYQAMLPVKEGVPSKNVQSALVARRFSSDVKAECKNRSVWVVPVPRA